MRKCRRLPGIPWGQFKQLLVLLATAMTAYNLLAEERPNILFVAIDDQNDWIGCLGGHPRVATPNIDALAARGTLFLNAHCQSPLCNPSRSSLLTGLRPSTTGIYGLTPGIRAVERTRALVTLPQTFTNAGYHTFTCGKVYHDGSIAPRDRAREFGTWGPAPGMGKPPRRIAKLPGTPHPLMDWGPFPDTDDKCADYKIADAAITALQQAPRDQPFFIACGFRLPHVPCFAPPTWFGKYPRVEKLLPPVRDDDRDDIPHFAWYLHWSLPEPRLHTLRAKGEWLPLVQAYLASTSFMDAQVGRLLAALRASGREQQTIVVLWSDHGWHLGEKGISGKNTLWERSTRVPLVFAGPNVNPHSRCRQPVELLDIFPTLLELTRLPARVDLEGHSLVPLLRDPGAKRPWPAITTHNQNNHAIRTDRWRYIRYANGSEELYDMNHDPNEWTNLALMPEHATTKSELARWLPTTNAPPAPGSAHRILIFDTKTGRANWEGKDIDPHATIPD